MDFNYFFNRLKWNYINKQSETFQHNVCEEEKTKTKCYKAYGTTKKI